MIQKIVIEKSTYFKDLSKLIFLLLLAILVIPTSMLDIVPQYAFLVSLGFLTYCSWKFHYYNSTSKWIKTKAIITNHKVVCLEKTDCESKVSTCDYVVRISYKYTYKGSTYEGNKVSLDKYLPHFGKNKAKAIGYVSAFLNKSTLYAYINPNNPHESVLDTKVSNRTIFNCTLCIILSAISLIGIIYFMFQ